MRRLLKRLKQDQKGMTLVELIVGMGLSTVVMGITLGIMLSSMNIYGRSANLNSASQLGHAVYEFYRTRLSSATAASINGGGAEQCIAINSDGQLTFQESASSSAKLVYDESIYAGNTLTVVTEAEGSFVTLSVRVYSRDGKGLYEKSSGFWLMNAGSATGDLDEQTDPDIYYTSGVE